MESLLSTIRQVETLRNVPSAIIYFTNSKASVTPTFAFEEKNNNIEK
jgi:hypothetical protein